MPHTVSVAMTTYNGERFLREQLDSIYSQTKVPDEVVVCDDNSSDGTVAILEEYKKKYGLKYYVNNPGLGVNENFFKAISLCQSDYIALSDQDDVWLPNKIEVTYNKLVEIDDGKPSVVSSLCNDIDAEGNLIQKKNDIADSYGYAATLLTIGHSQGCSLMMNRQLADLVINMKDSDIRIKNIMFDIFISFTSAIVGNKYNLGKRLMLYRHHNNNVVGKINKGSYSFRGKLLLRDKYVGFIPDSRFASIQLMYDLYASSDISNEKVVVFLKKLLSISQSNFFIGLMKICTLNEILFKRKISIVSKSIIVKIMRILFFC